MFYRSKPAILVKTCCYVSYLDLLLKPVLKVYTLQHLFT